MAKKKHGMRNGESYKKQYGEYKYRYAENRKKRIEKHLERHPNDVAAQEALKNASTYRRRTPRVKGGWIPTEWVRSIGLEHEHPINKVGPAEKRKVAQDIKFAKTTANMVRNNQFRVEKEKNSNFEFEDLHEKSRQMILQQQKEEKQAAA